MRSWGTLRRLPSGRFKPRTSAQTWRATPHRSRTIGGYALTFDQPSNLLPGAMIKGSPAPPSALLGGFIEQVAPSFCDQARANNFASIICRYNRDDNLVLGNVDADTLGVSVDGRGMDYTVDVPEWPGPPYLLEMVARGDVRHLSFTFCNAQDEWDYRDGMPVRTLLGGDIRDVAPVASAAYPDSSVALRSLAQHKQAPFGCCTPCGKRGNCRGCSRGLTGQHLQEPLRAAWRW
ncbi:HK97 family phage prohead protease [Mycobacterium asiaticum]|nr:HK97 family phage prohead protease [Mycobacterium asiaticum]